MKKLLTMIREDEENKLPKIAIQMGRLFFSPSLMSLLVVYSVSAQDGQLLSPAQFLGYEAGTKFTRHHRVVDYFEYIADNSPQVQFMPYGQTFEGRPLVTVAISSTKNIRQLETLRKGHLARIGLNDNAIVPDSQPLIVWLSYNIHGDEAVSSEAALNVLEKLTSDDKAVNEWLENTIVVIDPCLNPDGRDRYVNWYNNVALAQPNIDQNSEEHHSTWPGGRVNHYLFDLNRDWAWQVQVESQQRAVHYQTWMPHVHVDFHEMGINSPYFFAPAAHPMHENITPWQREFQELVGSNHAGYFDEEGWSFYTKEYFDLFYPSYGDTWPIFNGAMGFTYEQGGSRDAGVAVLNDHGDTLTLTDRVAHHYTTSLSTIEVAHLNRDRMTSEFEQYFQAAKSNPPGEYRSYVIKHSNDASRVKSLLQLLDRQRIEYSVASGSKKSYNGFDYFNNKKSSFTLEKNDIVVSAYQPKSVMLKVLFEPKSNLEDSLTYDVTAWALPYMYEVETYATSERIISDKKYENKFTENLRPKRRPAAYITDWNNVQDARFLSALLKENIKVRYNVKPITLDGKTFNRGSLIVARFQNKHIKNLDEKIIEIANANEQSLHYATTAMAEKGPDLGSDQVRYMSAPKVAILNGKGIDANAFGEVWYYFDQDIEYPFSVLNMDYASGVDFSEYDVLVLPSGSYGKLSTQLLDFARGGGKIIAIERAIGAFTSGDTQLAKAMKNLDNKGDKNNEKSKLKRYEDSERSSLSSYVAGTIYKVHLDDSHPLAFGEDESIHIMRRNSTAYPYIDGWNVGVIKNDGHVSGFVGHNLKCNLVNSLEIGQENIGSGSIIYFVDSPVFRGFWYSGKLLMGNAVFFD